MCERERGGGGGWRVFHLLSFFLAFSFLGRERGGGGGTFDCFGNSIISTLILNRDNYDNGYDTQHTHTS